MEVVGDVKRAFQAYEGRKMEKNVKNDFFKVIKFYGMASENILMKFMSKYINKTMGCNFLLFKIFLKFISIKISIQI